MPARRSKSKSATRKKATTRRKTAARRKPAAKTSEQLGAPLSPPEPVGPTMPAAEPSLVREESTPQPASPLPEMDEADERGLSMDFSEREEEPGKDS
jgi:hypothetical protein